MKRLAVSVVIVFLLVGFSFVANGLTNKGYNEITRLLIMSEEQMAQGEFERAKETALLAEKEFIKAEKGLKLFINEDLLNEVGLKLSELPPLCAEDTLQDFFSSSNAAKTALLHIKNGQKAGI